MRPPDAHSNHKTRGGGSCGDKTANKCRESPTCDSQLRTNHTLKAATEDVRSGWFRNLPHTFLMCATSVNGPSSALG